MTRILPPPTDTVGPPWQAGPTLIEGYPHGPQAAGEPPPERPGFRADGADTDALYDTLGDQAARPVLTVPFGGSRTAGSSARRIRPAEGSWKQ